MNDPVNHPKHYTQGNIECIEVIKDIMSPDGFQGFLRGNVMKYLWRANKKNGIEDYKKAQWYLYRLIAEMECTNAEHKSGAEHKSEAK